MFANSVSLSWQSFCRQFSNITKTLHISFEYTSHYTASVWVSSFEQMNNKPDFSSLFPPNPGWGKKIIKKSLLVGVQNQPENYWSYHCNLGYLVNEHNLNCFLWICQNGQVLIFHCSSWQSEREYCSLWFIFYYNILNMKSLEEGNVFHHY